MADRMSTKPAGESEASHEKHVAAGHQSHKNTPSRGQGDAEHGGAHQGAAHHRQAAEHHEHAARHHRTAAEHHEAGRHEEGAHHSEMARGHELHATEHGAHASRHHAAEHAGAEEAGLKAREYRGPGGEVHYHTTTYMEQHRGEAGGRGGEHGGRGR